MTDRFAVGEVAIYVGPESPWRGFEVTVMGPLTHKRWQGRDGKMYESDCYHIQIPYVNEDFLIAEPHELRKKPPPQDWVRICRLSERPVEEPA